MAVVAGASAVLGVSAASPPHFYVDDKWKLSKKDGSSRSRSSTASPVKNSPPATATAQRQWSFTKKCARLVKEQRARFYVTRRCVTMLICWRD